MPMSNEPLVSLSGKTGKSNTHTMMALTEDDILAEIAKLGKLNQQIFCTCLELADGLMHNKLVYSYDESSASFEDKKHIRLQIALALFDPMSISSYTILRSRLEQELWKR